MSDERDLVVVQYPPQQFPTSEDAHSTWDAVEPMLNEILGRAGLGQCTVVDYSSELTFISEVTDASLAVDLIRSGLDIYGYLDGAVIAVKREGRSIITWSSSRAGEIIY